MRSLILLTSVIVWPAVASDVPGSQDPPAFKRFAGSEIISYTGRNYDQYTLALAGGSPRSGFGRSASLEGAIARWIYRVPAGHTSLEVFRSYERTLAASGFRQSFEIAPCRAFDFAGYFFSKFYLQNESASSSNGTPFGGAACYAAEEGKISGQPAAAAVLVVDATNYLWRSTRRAGDLQLHQGEVLVGLDLVTPKPLQIRTPPINTQALADPPKTRQQH